MKKLGPLFAFAAVALSMSAKAAEYIVKYKESSQLASVKSISGLKVLDEHTTGRLLKVFIKDQEEAKALAKLLKNPEVEYAVKNFKVHRFQAPFEIQTLRDQWAIAKVNAEKAWARAGNKGSRNVVVAVIDTGLDYNHDSLKANAVQGYNFKDKNDNPMDITSSDNPGHGTHCAGIIGATGTADNGTIGISPEVSIMPLRFLDEHGSGDLMDGIIAIDFAIEKKVKVISASWGATVSRSEAQPLVEAVKRADDAGIIFVVAAANDGKSNDVTEVYPANAGFPNTITVAASGSNDEKPSWSNFGKAKVHVAAPGLNIMSTLPKNTYGNLSGTSMATPLVSGLVALLMAQDDTLTGAQVRALLQTTGAKVSIETACNCRVDAAAAMNALLDKKMVVTPAAATLSLKDTQQFSTLHGKAPFTFVSSNKDVADITSAGLLTAASKGETTIEVTDAAGVKASSLAIRVVDGSSGGGGGGGDPTDPTNPTNPTDPSACPFQDPQMCQLMCQFEPTLPWCKQK